MRRDLHKGVPFPRSPAIPTTLESVRKGFPGDIKASQINRKPHYAEGSDFWAPARQKVTPLSVVRLLFNLGRLYVNRDAFPHGV